MIRRMLLFLGVLCVSRMCAGYSFTVTTNDTAVTVLKAEEGSVDTLTVPFLAPDVSQVTYNLGGEVVHYLPNVPATYAGGTFVKHAQLRIGRGDALGYGPVVLGVGTEGSGMLVAEGTCTVTNKLVFTNDSAWVTSAAENYTLTVNRLAARQGGFAARFGREGNPSSLVFDLAEDEGNEPLNAIVFRGSLFGTLGGTLKIARSGKWPFLRNSQPAYTPMLQIAPKGVNIHVAAAANALLATNVVVANPACYDDIGAQTVVPEDASFEDGGAGWTGTRVDSGSGATIPGVVANDNATWVNGRVTPFGTHVMVLRTGHRLTSPEVTIPTQGVWRLNFWRVGRSGYSGYDMETEVVFTHVETGAAQTNTLAAMETDSSRFVQALTPGFDLAAGRYRFSIYPRCKNNTSAMLYDNFCVEEADKLVYPGNSDFETGTPAWTFRKVESKAGDALSGVYANGNQYNPTRFTPFGTNSYLLRTGHELTSPAFEIPADGSWRLNFWRVGRANYSGAAAETEIVFRDGDGVAVTNVLAGYADTAAYQQALSPAFDLKAGTYTFSIHPRCVSSTATMFYDRFVVEKVQIVRTSGGAVVTKQGPGRLVMPLATTYTNPFVVEEGALGFQSASFSKATAQVTGGRLELDTGTVLDAGSTVTVASGATLELSDLGENLVVNGSFEFNKIAPTGFNYQGGANALDAWQVSVVTPNAQNKNGGDIGGVQGNGGNITAEGPETTFGTYTAALREHTALQQTVTVAAEGDYVLSFVYAMRRGYGANTAGRVLVDGAVVVARLPKNQEEFQRVTESLHLTAGDHVLTFEVSEGTDVNPGPMMLVDDVLLRKVETMPMLQGKLTLASGSTLELNNTVPLELEVGSVTVDGEVFRGGRNALVRRGVTVCGDGSLQVGGPVGTLILLR